LAAQRLALPAAGGTRFAHETDKTQSYEKSHFDGANPAVRVHAMLGRPIIYEFDRRTEVLPMATTAEAFQ
jgi:hypothetical protein